MAQDLLVTLVEQMRDENNRRFCTMGKSIDRIAASLENFGRIEQITQSQAHLIAQQSDSIIALTTRLNNVEQASAVVMHEKDKSDRVSIGLILAAGSAVIALAFKILGLV